MSTFASREAGVVAETDGLHRRFSYSWLAHAVRTGGVLAAARAAWPFFSKLVRLWWWDTRHHVSTRTRVFKGSLGVTGPGAAHARAYEASGTTLLPGLLQRLNVVHRDYVFVDLGAGKGQAVFLAAEFSFKRVVGVELSPALHETALQNCRTFRSRRRACDHIDMVCGDAADFHFPREPLVIYLFNSFDDVVLLRVLDNLTASVRAQPREVLLIYHNPQHRDLVQASGFFEPMFSGTDERDFRKVGYAVFRHRG